MGCKTLIHIEAERTVKQLNLIYSDSGDNIEGASFSSDFVLKTGAKKTVDGLEIPSMIWYLESKWILSKL